MRSDVNCDKFNVFVEEGLSNPDVTSINKMLKLSHKLPSIQLPELVSAAEDNNLMENGKASIIKSFLEISPNHIKISLSV